MNRGGGASHCCPGDVVLLGAVRMLTLGQYGGLAKFVYILVLIFFLIVLGPGTKGDEKQTSIKNKTKNKSIFVVRPLPVFAASDF